MHDHQKFKMHCFGELKSRQYHSNFTRAPILGGILKHTGCADGMYYLSKHISSNNILSNVILYKNYLGDFFTKVLSHGSHFGLKISLKKGPISPKKKLKSAVFKVDKPLEMGPDLRECKKYMKSNQPFYEREKSLDLFGPCVTLYHTFLSICFFFPVLDHKMISPT